MPRSAPVHHAIGSSTSAPSATREKATNSGGMPSSTAILMNRYGMPQIRDIATNSTQARGDTPPADYVVIAQSAAHRGSSSPGIGRATW